MIPFHADPNWYDKYWYGAPESQAEAIFPPRAIRLLGRIVVWVALVAAIPAVSYLGFRAAALSPAPSDRLPVRLG